jgi:hypothetical protein
MQPPTPVDRSSQDCDLVDRAVALWRKAQVLYEASSWEGRPEARATAEQIAASHPECEPLLASLLFDNSQLVAAYALLTLERMRSSVLQDLPSAVLESRSNVALVYSGIKTSMELGILARQVQERARKRASDRPTSVES